MPETPTPSLIHARGLTKRFGEFVAVDAIDFDVAPGELFGFLGPERRRQDLHDADDRLRLADQRRDARRSWAWTRRRTARRSGRSLGVVPQQDTLDIELTVRENLVDLRPLLRAQPGRGRAGAPTSCSSSPS